ncbi:alpha-galactosidase [Nakamurella aerolata]|nr:alpha-galactosidase [Nakamurella aerolata]
MPEQVSLPLIFPTPESASSDSATTVVLDADPRHPQGLPVLRLLGTAAEVASLAPAEAAALAGPHRGTPLLTEQYRPDYTRPGLRGFRPGTGTLPAGRDWSPMLQTEAITAGDGTLTIDAVDPVAGLALRTEVQTLTGGALRARHTLRNTGSDHYLLQGLEVSVPLADDHIELLDFTGRHLRERIPQRHRIADGLWDRQSRLGRPGLDSTTMLVAGTPGFDFGSGSVIAAVVATSGNSSHAVQRGPWQPAQLSAGELLQPGEIDLAPDESYTTPWVVIAARTDGLDGLADALHQWQRSLPAHTEHQPVTLNVWEAVYFDHDLAQLLRLAELAAQVGVERYVLDDGWFHLRRNDSAGLGDWWVDPTVWPDGLTPLIEKVHQLGMQFGLWFEPEMVNPDSDLFTEHPDWILQTGDRTPVPERQQQVVDLTNPAAWQHIRDSIDKVLTDNAVDYVKWDHNRPLLDAGSNTRAGAPAAHRQAEAFAALLADLRARHPQVAWESCASGGGRIDLAVIEQVQRFWTSDMTDALARQQIQRWTSQLIAPEYLGAHVSAPVSHQTRRQLGLPMRAAVAMFGAFGVEWNITKASEAELAELAEWIALYKTWRPLLHTGRVVRFTPAEDQNVQLNGVIAADRRSALLAVVQLDESMSNRGTSLKVPGLDPQARYQLSWLGGLTQQAVGGEAPHADPAGPTGGVPVTGAVLATVGFWMPRRLPQTAQLIEIQQLS